MVELLIRREVENVLVLGMTCDEMCHESCRVLKVNSKGAVILAPIMGINVWV